MVSRNKPDPEALAAARAAANAKRLSVGLPIEEERVVERRKPATEREVHLYAIRVAGYHRGASVDVQKLRYKVGREAYSRALKEGAAAKARGDVCHCIDCYNERLAAKEGKAPL